MRTTLHIQDHGRDGVPRTLCRIYTSPEGVIDPEQATCSTCRGIHAAMVEASAKEKLLPRDLLRQLADEAFMLSEGIRNFLVFADEENGRRVVERIGGTQTLIRMLQDDIGTIQRRLSPGLAHPVPPPK